MPLLGRLKRTADQQEDDLFSGSQQPEGAYSHGFEQIYSLETIDPKTIKVMSARVEEAPSLQPAMPWYRMGAVQSGVLDFREWITSLAEGVGKPKLFLLLKEHKLEQFLSLTPTDHIALKRLTREKSEEWSEEAAASLREEGRRRLFTEKMEGAFAQIALPWMEARGRIARADELLERFEKCAAAPHAVSPLFSFFEALYGDPYGRFLLPLGNGYYAADNGAKEAYRRIELEAFHLVKGGAVDFNWLAAVLEQELALPREQVVRALLAAGCLAVKRGEGGFVIAPSPLADYSKLCYEFDSLTKGR